MENNLNDLKELNDYITKGNNICFNLIHTSNDIHKLPLNKSNIIMRLNISNCVRLSNIDNIFSFRFIKVLIMSNNNIQGTVNLSSLNKLETVDLSNNKIECILLNKSINLLNVSHNNLSVLNGLNAITELDASYNILNNIKNFNKAKKINLSHNMLSNIDTDSFIEVVSIDLSYNNLSRLYFKNNKSIKVINLSYNHITIICVNINFTLDKLILDGNLNVNFNPLMFNTINELHLNDMQLTSIPLIILLFKYQIKTIIAKNNNIRPESFNISQYEYNYIL